MTVIEALRAKMYPYELPEDTLQVILIDRDLEPSEAYDTIDHSLELKFATLEGLYQVLTLTEESDNGSKQKYDVDALMKRIGRLEDELDVKNAVKPQHKDITEYW
jgi:hypothetical protein